MKRLTLLLILLSALTITNALWPIYFYSEDSDGNEEEAGEAPKGAEEEEENQEEAEETSLGETVIGSAEDYSDDYDNDGDDGDGGEEEEQQHSGGDKPKSGYSERPKGKDKKHKKSTKSLISLRKDEKKKRYIKAPIPLKGYGLISCYCFDLDFPLFLVDLSTRIAGRIELRGSYDKQGNFQPRGFKGKELSTIDHFGNMCDRLFKVCRTSGGCWADQSPLERN